MIENVDDLTHPSGQRKRYRARTGFMASGESFATEMSTQSPVGQAMAWASQRTPNDLARALSKRRSMALWPHPLVRCQGRSGKGHSESCVCARRTAVSGVRGKSAILVKTPNYVPWSVTIDHDLP